MYQQKKWALFLLTIYVIIWSLLAISPVNRFNWLLENGLIFAFLIFIFFLNKYIPFSILSYCAMTIYLILHTIGAHYSYQTPLDTWLHLKRNYYDRVVHFSFGFCLFLPVYETLRFFFPLYRQVTIIFVNLLLLAASAIYEILEVWVVYLVAPREGALFLGLQGDPWDAQHDMEIALLGSILASIIYVIANKHKKQLSPT